MTTAELQKLATRLEGDFWMFASHLRGGPNQLPEAFFAPSPTPKEKMSDLARIVHHIKCLQNEVQEAIRIQMVEERETKRRAEVS